MRAGLAGATLALCLVAAFPVAAQNAAQDKTLLWRAYGDTEGYCRALREVYGDPFQGKLAFPGREPSIAELANEAHVTRADREQVEKYAAAYHRCVQMQVRFSERFTPWAADSSRMAMGSMDIVLADLIAGKIVYGEANRKLKDLGFQAKAAMAAETKDYKASLPGGPAADAISSANAALGAAKSQSPDR